VIPGFCPGPLPGPSVYMWRYTHAGTEETAMLRILGIIALIWIGLMLLGAVFKFLVWALVIGAVLFVGSAIYTAVKGKDEPKALR